MESLQKGTLVIDKLEGRFGRFAIPNVTLFLIAGQVLTFVAILTFYILDIADICGILYFDICYSADISDICII